MSRKPEDLGPAGPALGPLLDALTAAPTQAELAGEQAAVTMFRTVSAGGYAHADGQAPADPPADQVPSHRTRPIGPPGPAKPARQPRDGFLPGGWRLRVGLAAAVLALAGTVAAAYAAALPPPVQHIAYQLLGFAGVPDARASALSPGGQASPRPGPGSAPGVARSGNPTSGPGSTAPSAPGRGRHRSSGPSRTPSPSPSSPAPRPAPARLSIAASQAQIPAGDTAVLTGRVTQGGKPAAGVRVTLMERLAGTSGWVVAGTARSSASGAVVAHVAQLTANAVFRFAGPHGVASPKVAVTVVPAVTLRVVPLPRLRDDAFVVGSSYAEPGDTVLLQWQSAGTWVTAREHRLNARGGTAFAIRARRAAGRTFRVVLLATAEHGQAASVLVTGP